MQPANGHLYKFIFTDNHWCIFFIINWMLFWLFFHATKRCFLWYNFKWQLSKQDESCNSVAASDTNVPAIHKMASKQWFLSQNFFSQKVKTTPFYISCMQSANWGLSNQNTRFARRQFTLSTMFRTVWTVVFLEKPFWAFVSNKISNAELDERKKISQTVTTK